MQYPCPAVHSGNRYWFLQCHRNTDFLAVPDTPCPVKKGIKSKKPELPVLTFRSLQITPAVSSSLETGLIAVASMLYGFVVFFAAST